MSSDRRSVAAWLAGALFIPSLALALGIWSGGSKTFEAIYVAWWYIGPAHQIPGLDFMGTTPASSSPAAYSMAAALLLVAAYWRRRQSLGYA
jgi:MYXO-CTERM domain-containing protein